MSKAVFKMELDFGRMGDLEGVFIAHKEAVEKLFSEKTEVYFGEALGKHSECSWSFDEQVDDRPIKMVTDDPHVIEVIEKHSLSSGYNPFDYIDDAAA